MSKTKPLTPGGARHIQLTRVLRENSSRPTPLTATEGELAAEWYVTESHVDREGGNTCLCGQEDIVYVSTIHNVYNDVHLFPLGSECIKRFGIPDLGLTCHCCAKPIYHGNRFVDAYMKGRPLTKHTSILGHAPCVRRTLRRWWNSRSWILRESTIVYFRGMGIELSVDRAGDIDVEYTDDTLTPYVDELIACM